MKILIAEDEPVSRRVLEVFLAKWGYEVVSAKDGKEAWEILQRADPPLLLIMDWQMPGMDGVEVCRKARQRPELKLLYIILLTGMSGKEQLIQGLEAGANDYVTKPFDQAEMLARIRVGARVVQLQNELSTRVCEVEEAMARLKQLQGLLPICSYCRKVRDDKNYWQQVESYISDHSLVQFSHGVCPDCHEKIVKPELERLLKASPKQEQT